MHTHYNPAVVLREGLELFGFVPDLLQHGSKTLHFEDLFGADPTLVSKIWDDIELREANDGASLKHLFWTLHYFKNYPNKANMLTYLGDDFDTMRHWICRFTEGLAALSAKKIALPSPDERLHYLTVDSAVFRLEEQTQFDHTWHSHQSRTAAVKYEVALTMDGMIAWVNGPFKGSVHDVTIYRQDLMARIPKGKAVIADKAYRGQPNVRYAKDAKSLESRAMTHQETVFERFKDFKILAREFRDSHGDPLVAHRPVFFAIAVIMQYKIKHGD